LATFPSLFVHAKPTKFMPTLIKTLKKFDGKVQNIFWTQPFGLSQISNHLISFMSKIFCSTRISQILTKDNLWTFFTGKKQSIFSFKFLFKPWYSVTVFQLISIKIPSNLFTNKYFFETISYHLVEFKMDLIGDHV